MVNKYNFPFYKYPLPGHRVSPRKLWKVYKEKRALHFCARFNLEDQLENLPMKIIEQKETKAHEATFIIVYNNPNSVEFSTILSEISVENYIQMSEEERKLYTTKIRTTIKNIGREENGTN